MIICKGKKMRLTGRFFITIMEPRRQYDGIFQVLRKNNRQPRTVAWKITFQNRVETKMFLVKKNQIYTIYLHPIHFFLNLFLYYIGFAIYQHESATGIHVFPILNPPPSPYHPSGSSQCTSPKHPVSCIEPGLATCFIYDIIHVSMPFSQIIPPSPSPTESTRLFYTSVSLLLSRI